MPKILIAHDFHPTHRQTQESVDLSVSLLYNRRLISRLYKFVQKLGFMAYLSRLTLHEWAKKKNKGNELFDRDKKNYTIFHN